MALRYHICILHRMKFAAVSLAVLFSLSALTAQQNNPIVKLDPSLDAILPPGTKLEKLADGFVFLEGPVWVRSGGYLLFSNMPERFIASGRRMGRSQGF